MSKMEYGEEVTLAKVKFVPTIGLGNIITFVGMIVLGSGIWFGLVSKVDATVELNTKQDRQIEKLANQAQVNSERVGKIEVAITFIAPALQRIEDKVSKK